MKVKVLKVDQDENIHLIGGVFDVVRITKGLSPTMGILDCYELKSGIIICPYNVEVVDSSPIIKKVVQLSDYRKKV